MLTNFKVLTLFSLTILLTSCASENFFQHFIPEESEIAKELLFKVREQDLNYVKGMMAPELKPKVDEALLARMSELFREGELISVSTIGSQVQISNDQWQGNFTFEYEFESGWNLANAVLRKTNTGYEVIGMNVYQTENSQKEINAFSLSSKSSIHYAVLLFAIIVPVFILSTLIVCIRTPMARRKWLWILFILSGVSAIKLNWTTGAYSIHLLSVNLLGASAMSAGTAAPWVLSVSLPVGAILFWVKRRRFETTPSA